jgi:hypothetical protein
MPDYSLFWGCLSNNQLQNRYNRFQQRMRGGSRQVSPLSPFHPFIAQRFNYSVLALIVPCRDFTPCFGNNCFLAENATLIGDVVMGVRSLWV